MRFPTLEDELEAKRFGEEREAFLLALPDEDREEVDILCRVYDSMKNDCGLNDQEKIMLADMQVKYPGISDWLF